MFTFTFTYSFLMFNHLLEGSCCVSGHIFCIAVHVFKAKAYKRTLMYVANALRQQAAAADAETSNGKLLRNIHS